MPLPDAPVVNPRLVRQLDHGVSTPIDPHEVGESLTPTIQVKWTAEFPGPPHLDLEPRRIGLQRERLRAVAAVLAPPHLPLSRIVPPLHAVPSSMARSSAADPRS